MFIRDELAMADDLNGAIVAALVRCRGHGLTTAIHIQMEMELARRARGQIRSVREAADHPMRDLVAKLEGEEARLREVREQIEALTLEARVLCATSDAETQPLVHSPARDDQEKLKRLAADRDARRKPLDERIARLRQVEPAHAARIDVLRADLRQRREAQATLTASEQLIEARQSLEQLLAEVYAFERGLQGPAHTPTPTAWYGAGHDAGGGNVMHVDELKVRGIIEQELRVSAGTSQVLQKSAFKLKNLRNFGVDPALLPPPRELIGMLWHHLSEHKLVPSAILKEIDETVDLVLEDLQAKVLLRCGGEVGNLRYSDGGDYWVLTTSGLAKFKGGAAPSNAHTTDAGPRARQEPQGETMTTETRSILFLDVTGWSSLNSDEIQRYVSAGMPRIANEIKSRTFLNTWGDAIVATFGSAKLAAEAALSVRDFFKKGYASDGIKPGLSCRISLHVGEVILGHNALTEKEDIFGHAVHVAARLEPVTARGHVFCTKAFADRLAEVSGSAPKAWSLGTRPLAKSFGEEEVFVVTWTNDDDPRDGLK